MLSYGVRYAMLVGRVREHRHPRCGTPSMNFDHSRRLLFGALLSSLLLHLFLVFGWGWARPLPPSLPQPAMQVVVSAKPTAAPLAPLPPKSSPVLMKRQELLPRDKPVAAPRTQPTEVAPAPVAGQVSPEMAVTASPASSAKAQPETEGINERTNERTNERANERVSVDGLRQYRIELAGAARRFRNYPALARSRGWEGVAEVSVAVNAGMPSPSVKLVKSSGHGVLDDQALAMLSRAVAATPLPESLQGHSFVVPMPIRFSLEE